MGAADGGLGLRNRNSGGCHSFRQDRKWDRAGDALLDLQQALSRLESSLQGPSVWAKRRLTHAPSTISAAITKRVHFLWDLIPSDTNGPMLYSGRATVRLQKEGTTDYDEDKMIPSARGSEQNPSQIFVSDMPVTQHAAPLGERVPSKHVSCRCLTGPRRSLLYARLI